MVTGNAKCLPTIFQVGYLWLDNLLRFNFYSSLQLIHLRFTIHLIMPGTVKNLINNYTSLYLSLSLSTPSRACQPTSVPEPSSWASFSATYLITHKQLSNMCRKLQRLYCTQGFKAAIRSQPQLRAGRIPSHDNQSHKLNTSNLEVRTFTMYRYMFYRKRNSFARVLNCYFILPTCKFAYLSAEHISDLGSN